MPPKDYRHPTAMDARDDLRRMRARERAHLAVQRAEFIFAKAKGNELSADERQDLAKAAESLNAYLAELER